MNAITCYNGNNLHAISRENSGGGGNYCKYGHLMTAKEYAPKVVKNEFQDPVMSFQLKNGFIEIFNDPLDDRSSLNHTSSIEWSNQKYVHLYNYKIII